MDYEDLPAIIGIDEAIKADSFLEVCLAAVVQAAGACSCVPQTHLFAWQRDPGGR